MEERGNKTIMCSVMFLDIVAYSRKSVSAQIAQKELFNRLLGDAISHVPLEDRVILDTGDGAAITFLGDVEDALKASLSFRDGLLSEDAQMDPPLQVCIGINLGPVRLVKDINGRPNIVGDGINVAQRIMGFAKPGQILASRSYVDGAARLSHEYAGMFRREGMRADKHDRVHEVFSIGRPGEIDAAKTGEDTLSLSVKTPLESATGKLQIALDKFKNAPLPQRALYTSIAITTLLLLIAIGVKISNRDHAQDTSLTPVAMAPAASSVPASTTMSASSVAATPTASKRASPPMEEKKNAQHLKDETRTEKKKDSEQKPKPVPASKLGATATVDIIVSPWGEIYLDGTKQGVSPPIDDLHVSPGKHIIEVRNTTFPPYTLSIDVKAGEKLKIKHKFGF